MTAMADPKQMPPWQNVPPNENAPPEQKKAQPGPQSTASKAQTKVNGKGKGKKGGKVPKEPKKRYDIFRRRRGGVLLTREEVKEIKAGRKKLRKELRKIGEKSRKEFELTASSLGLYFDKNKLRTLLAWLFATKGFWFLLMAGILMIMAIAGFALLAEMQGHFTISMSDEMFKEGFVISEDPEFLSPTSHLFATPAVDVPCISIVDIPENVDEIDGEHNGNYFAYTFYLRNEGQNVADYRWEIRFNSESIVADASWVMLFIDGEMTIYAKAADDGREEALPTWENNEFGYLKAPLYDKAIDKSQYAPVATVGGLTYWRVIPKSFAGDGIMSVGERWGVQPDEVHKYTIVVWLEGDDPDCTNELIGKHMGFEMYMHVIEEEEEDK